MLETEDTVLKMGVLRGCWISGTLGEGQGVRENAWN